MLLAACMIFAVLGVSSGAIVAFSAAFDVDSQLKTGEKLVPNKVLINHGGGYDNSTGVFTAPQSGIYLLQFHALTTKTGRSWISLYHNDVYVISAFARQTADYDSLGNSAILNLKKNDKVYLKARYDGNVYGRPDDIYTTFSGYSIGLFVEGYFV